MRRRGSRPLKQFGKAATLLLHGAHVEFLTLIDIWTEGRWRGLIEFVAASFSGFNQVRHCGLAVTQTLDPAFQMVQSLRIGCSELPCVGERLH
jgi:hypothetical protein